jgi:arabinosaccharide transport system substrate-binding protein
MSSGSSDSSRSWGSWAREGGDYLSAGSWIILFLAVISLVGAVFIPSREREGLRFWTFARNHYVMYEPMVQEWNRHREADQPEVQVYLIGYDAMIRRMMSGFVSGTPIADLIEVERNMVGQVFAGPLEDVGFLDLTDRLEDEGLLEQINAASLTPWMRQGRIFGLPHDVHPVVLAYRADLVEQAGIDMSQIETWEDFARVMRPLIRDLTGDGRIDRWPLNFWHTNQDLVMVLLLQAGGGFFDPDGGLIIASETNAHVLATLVSWITGPDRIAADAPEFSASGNQLRLDGFIVCTIMPDWLVGVWKQDLPQLEGKLRVIPLPSWERGARRTSVMGGTMLGITRAAEDVEAAWEFATELYFSPRIARELYETASIISPMRSLWPEPFYHEPDPYFSNQRIGSLLIELAPDIPPRVTSPFDSFAQARVQEALLGLRRHAEAIGVYDRDALKPRAMELLEAAEERVRRQMERNVFLREQLVDSSEPEEPSE